jgi:SulP family sulfate permease
MTQAARRDRLSFAEQFTPKLVTVLREGYGARELRADAFAGLSVAIVALPLSIAIAVASGASPAQGLITAIVGGFVVSALGGSRFQIGGPAGAFIVLVAATLAEHGMDGLILAVFLSGFMLAALGFLRLGAFVKFVPYPVTVGFTAGIAIIIAASQLKDALGLRLDGAEPGPLLEKIPALIAAGGSFNPYALLVAFITAATVFIVKARRPQWPSILIAVALASVVAMIARLPVDTIAARFGDMPHGLPTPRLPALSFEKIAAVFPAAISFTILGAIESLLSAVVADGMTGRRHRSNCELAAQGAANIASALFGGICVTGTIARTATNVRAGAHGPVSGMLHSVFVLAMMAVAAPLIGHTPMAALAGVLLVTAWNMFEKRAFMQLLRASRGDALVLLATFLLTAMRDLTEAILVGFALGAMVFIQRMSETAAVEHGAPTLVEDEADDAQRAPYHEGGANPDIVVYRISGAFFFGAAASIGSVLDRIGDTHRTLIIDFAASPFIDSTGAHMIEGLVESARHKGVAVYLTGLGARPAASLEALGVAPPAVVLERTIEAALARARRTDPAAAKEAIA